jgi:hypothetical protein
MAARHGGTIGNQNAKKERSVQLNTPFSTTAERAEMAGVSGMTQRRADTIAKASPELARKVAHGEEPLPSSTHRPKRAEGAWQKGSLIRPW